MAFAVFLLSVLIALPAGADTHIPELTADEFNELFTTADLPNLNPIGPAPSITGNASTDARIREIAEGRGYLRRPLPAGPLASADGLPIQPEAGEAWEALEAAARDAGFDLVLISAYRSEATQRYLFTRRLSSYTDTEIDRVLRTVAAPGYSKHHTGYAIDITQAGYSAGNFVNSPAFAWLSADNYAVAKQYGWVPSYPDGATAQGPIPEPWEYTWVGDSNFACWQFSPSDGDPFCDDWDSMFGDDIAWLNGTDITRGCNPPDNDRFCPTEPVTRGQMAAFIVRAVGLTDDGDGNAFVDDDGSTFENDIAKLAAAEITRGCNPPDNDRFCPAESVTRAQMAAFLVRTYGLTDDGGGNTFVDDDGSVFESDIAKLAAAGITVGCNPPDNDRFCPFESVTRQQMAAFLRRAEQQ